VSIIIPNDYLRWSKCRQRWYQTTWERKFTILPRRSEYTNKLIWFKQAWRGQTLVDGLEEPVLIEEWVTDSEFIWIQLQQP
jgi:hypothetical protein